MLLYTPCECDILRTVSPIDFKFEICYQTTGNTDAIDFILSRQRTLLILGHLLKPRWPPYNFICMV